jgi:hypothetical protein
VANKIPNVVFWARWLMGSKPGTWIDLQVIETAMLLPIKMQESCQKETYIPHSNSGTPRGVNRQYERTLTL